MEKLQLYFILVNVLNKPSQAVIVKFYILYAEHYIGHLEGELYLRE